MTKSLKRTRTKIITPMMTPPDTQHKKPMMTTMTNDDLEKAKFYLEEAHAFFDLIQETRRRIDEKIFNMILLSGALINIVVGLGYFLVQQNAVKSPNVIWFLVASASLYFGTTIIGLIFYRPQKQVFRNIRKVIEKYEKEGHNSTLISVMQSIAWNLSHDAEENDRITVQKAKAFQAMLILFVIGLAFLIWALISLAYGL